MTETLEFTGQSLVVAVILAIIFSHSVLRESFPPPWQLGHSSPCLVSFIFLPMRFCSPKSWPLTSSKSLARLIVFSLILWCLRSFASLVWKLLFFRGLVSHLTSFLMLESTDYMIRLKKKSLFSSKSIVLTTTLFIYLSPRIESICLWSDFKMQVKWSLLSSLVRSQRQLCSRNCTMIYCAVKTFNHSLRLDKLLSKRLSQGVRC